VLLVLLVALVPLIITPGILFYFDVTPKLIVLLMGTGCALIWRSPGSFAGGRARLLYLLLGAQAVSLAVSTTFSSHRALSIWGSNWRSLGLIAQIALLLFAAVTLAWAAGNPARIRLLVRAAAGAGCLAAAYGILQYFGWDPWLPAKAYQAGEGIYTIVRPPGTMGHAGYFGNYLVFVVFAGVAEGGTLGWCAVALGSTAAVLSGTRGALAGLAAGAIYLAVRCRPRISRRVVAVTAAVVLAAGTFYLSPAGARLRSRVHWISEDVGGGARLYLWRDSLRFGARHWMLGSGPETFAPLFPPFESEELARAYPDFYYESPHNLFLDALAAQGVIGLAVTLGWIALGLWSATPALRAGLIAAVVSHSFAVLILPTAMYFYLFVALSVAGRSEPARMARRWVLAPLAAAMIFLACRLLLADRSLELARRDLAAGRTMDGMQHYGAARARGLAADVWYARALAPLAPFEAIASAQRATSSEDAQNAYYTLAWLYARAGDVSHTEQSLRAAIGCAPNWFKPHWMLARILQSQGRTAEARAEAERAVYLNAGKNPEVAATVSGR